MITLGPGQCWVYGVVQGLVLLSALVGTFTGKVAKAPLKVYMNVQHKLGHKITDKKVCGIGMVPLQLERQKNPDKNILT